MAQEGTLWPISLIRIGPRWHNSKITWANNIVHAVMDVDNILNMVGAIQNTVAH